jgi:hypothetical protein
MRIGFRKSADSTSHSSVSHRNGSAGASLTNELVEVLRDDGEESLLTNGESAPDRETQRGGLAWTDPLPEHDAGHQMAFS